MVRRGLRDACTAPKSRATIDCGAIGAGRVTQGRAPTVEAMNDGDRVLVMVCATQLQAQVVTAHLIERGVPARTTAGPRAGPIRSRHYEVWVPADQLEDARSIVADLKHPTGRGLLSSLRLLAVLVGLAVLLLLLIALARLFS